MCDQNLPMEILKKEKKKKEPSYGGFSLSLSLSLQYIYRKFVFNKIFNLECITLK